jgi:adenylate cyclase
VVQRLVADGIHSNAGLVAERKVATAMFVDLVGFSAMSERLDPESLLRVINGYYQRMSDAIDEHRGQVGSFVGDGIVA